MRSEPSLSETEFATQAYVIAIDENFIEPLAVFLHSLFKHTTTLQGADLILLYDRDTLSEQGLNKVREQVLARYPIRCHLLDCHDLIPTSIKWQPADHLSKATYYRLFFFDMLPEHVKRVVYLDVDMVVVGDVSSLFELAFDEPIAAVNHFAPQEEIRLWGDQGGGYFNAGVIVFDVPRIKRDRYVARYIEILETMSDRIVWHDQDVLNIAHQQGWYVLPWYFNLTRCAEQALAPVQASALRIIHFDGANKPWVARTVRPFEECWHAMYIDRYGHPHASQSRWVRLDALARHYGYHIKLNLLAMGQKLRQARALRGQA